MIRRPPLSTLSARLVVAAVGVLLAASTVFATAPAASAGPSTPGPSRSAPKQKDVQRSEWTSATPTATAGHLNADLPRLQQRGVKVSGWSQDLVAPAKLDVWLVHYSKASARALLARYGANRIVVEPVSRAPVRALGRLNDTPPY